MQFCVWIISILALLSFIPPAAQEEGGRFLPITPDNAHQLQKIAVLEYELDPTVKAMFQVEFHPTQSLLLSLEYNETIRIWNLERFEFVEALPLPTNYVTSFAISPDGKNIVYGGWDLNHQPDFATLNIWNVDKRENIVISREGNDNIDQIIYSGNGTQFAASGWDEDAIRVWPSDYVGDPINFVGHGNSVYEIAFAGQDLLITTGYDKEVRIWNLLTNKLERTIKGWNFILHPIEPLLIVISSEVTSSNVTYHKTLYDLEHPGLSIPLDFEGIPNIFNPSGEIVTVTSDGKLWLYDFETHERLVELKASSSDVIIFSPDNRFIATSIYDNQDAIAIWAIPVED